MNESGKPKVAVIGVGEVGRGWAALTTGSGWSTAIFDTDAKNMHEGQDDILRRVETLVGAGRIERAAADVGLGELRTGRSLLQAVGEADWIIEALPALRAAPEPEPPPGGEPDGPGGVPPPRGGGPRAAHRLRSGRVGAPMAEGA